MQERLLGRLTRTSIAVNFRDIIAEPHSNMELSSDFLFPFLISGLRSRLPSLSAGSARVHEIMRLNYEVQKRFVYYMHSYITHDHMMCLTFLFLNQFQISDKLQL